MSQLQKICSPGKRGTEHNEKNDWDTDYSRPGRMVMSGNIERVLKPNYDEDAIFAKKYFSWLNGTHDCASSEHFPREYASRRIYERVNLN